VRLWLAPEANRCAFGRIASDVLDVSIEPANGIG
jgi:hypothetical protein